MDAGDPSSYPGTGNTWFDMSGRGIDFTLENGVLFSTDGLGSMVFDGVNDRAASGNPEALNLPGDFTIELWIKLLDGGSSRYGRVIANDIWNGTGFTNGFAVVFDNVDRSFGFNFSTPLRGVGMPSLVGDWMHVVIARGADTIAVYMNGSRKSSTIYANSLASPELSTIGANPSAGEPCKMQAAIIRRYARALTASEVTQNFLATRGRFGIGDNTPPKITSSPITSATNGTLYSYTFTATDADGDPLTLFANMLPASGWLTFDPATGLLSGAPKKGDVHDCASPDNNRVHLTVADHNVVVSQSFTIIVDDKPPVGATVCPP